MLIMENKDKDKEDNNILIIGMTQRTGQIEKLKI